MSKIIFDMDGTLNYWDPNAHISKVAAPGYMRERKPIRNMVDASRLLLEWGFEQWIASSVLPYKHAIPDKNFWIDHVMPWVPEDQRIFIPYGSNKALVLKDVAEVGDVFVDDYTENLYAVDESLRGKGLTCVKAVNDINDTHHSWCGLRVSIYSDTLSIAETLEAFSLAKIERVKGGVV